MADSAMTTPIDTPPTLRLQFSHQPHQAQAVEAVVKVFDGQPLASNSYTLQQTQMASVEHAPDGVIANVLVISDEQLLDNVQTVQQANGIAHSTMLVPMKVPGEWDDDVSGDEGQLLVPVHDGDADRKEGRGKRSAQARDARSKPGATGALTVGCPLNFSIEMETGTGKTYTFIKTMYELYKEYGFRKFVVVVPSVAIREGTMKNLAITRQHFATEYNRVPFAPVLYDSGRLNELRNFAQSDALSVLVINIDSFTKDSNKINQKGERGAAPIEYIRAVQPIVIIDEPQNFETDIRRQAIARLNPLCTLRYSATLKNPYNLLYKLDPVRAYDLGLVKQIEVDGVVADEDHNQAFVELLEIEAKPRGMVATLRVDADNKGKPKRKDVKMTVGDDVFAKSGWRALYRDGYILNEIREDSVEFSGGRVVHLNQSQDALMDDTMRFQIERTVASHFAKLKRLQPQGIKVLSLFFIDRVANYRGYDEDGQPVPGKFARWFEEAFNRYAARKDYQGLIPHPVERVHGGYFSGDKKGKGSQARVEWVDTL